MKDVLLFTQSGCKKCEYVKEKIPKDVRVRMFDITTAEGMAEAAFYGIIGKHVPVLVENGTVVEGAIRIKNKLNELANN